MSPAYGQRLAMFYSSPLASVAASDNTAFYDTKPSFKQLFGRDFCVMILVEVVISGFQNQPQQVIGNSGFCSFAGKDR